MTQKQYAYFSAAIREGAKLRPQTTAQLFRDGKSCAIGAGAEAMGLPYYVDPADQYNVSIFQPYLDQINTTFPYLETTRTKCPLCVTECPADAQERPLGEIIWHLNDNAHSWTREQIADWLYEVEEKLGFITIDTEAHKPEVANDPLNVTV